MFTYVNNYPRFSCLALFIIVILAPLHLSAGSSHPSKDQHEKRHVTGTTHELIATHGKTRAEVDVTLHFFDHPEKVIRYREVTLADVVTKAGQLTADDHLLLNLFDDVEREVEVRRADTNVNGTFTVSARAPEGGTYVALATTGGRSLATIYIPAEGKFYKIISDPDTREHYLLEMHESDRDIIEGGPPLIPEPGPDDIREQKRIRNHIEEKNYGPDDMARIGVMVVYTPAARQWGQSSGGGIENIVAISMVNAQMTLDNSDTRAVMELVHAGEVNYQEGPSASEDLNLLTEGFGNLSQAHDWRDEYGADLVALFADVSDVGGLAWLLNNRDGNPERGFSLTRVRQAANGYTHIHEMGHNMGLHHHANQNHQPGPTNWINWSGNGWSAGWRWTGTNGGYYCSVMTYSGGQFFSDGIDHTIVPYYSNPDVIHQEVPTGDRLRGDNARTVREIKHAIAAYRPNKMFTLVTNQPENIRAFEATGGGTVIEDAGQEVVTRGIVWNSTGNPSLENHEGKLTEGQGPGLFTFQITDLEPVSTYYVRAFAHTSDQTYYGHIRDFTTREALSPEVDTKEASLVLHHRAEAGGTVKFDGNTDITQRGLVWSISSNPTLENHQGKADDGSGEGDFFSVITDLEPETKYYYRAYATNYTDTSYGNEHAITTPRFLIYPNPVSEELNIAFYNQSDKEVVIRLINTQGQVAKERRVPEMGDFVDVLHTTHLRSGLYYLQIDSDDDFPVWPVMVSPQR